MAKFNQKLIQISDNEFRLELEEDPAHPSLGDHPVWSYFTEPPIDLGAITKFLSNNDPRRAELQFDEAYSHGGGWHHLSGFKRLPNPETNHPSFSIQYPGDAILHPLAMTSLRDQWIAFYRGAWMAVFDPDGSFSISRMN